MFRSSLTVVSLWCRRSLPLIHQSSETTLHITGQASLFCLLAALNSPQPATHAPLRHNDRNQFDSLSKAYKDCLRAGRHRESFRNEDTNFLFTFASRPAMGHTQSPFQWALPLVPSSVKVTNARSSSSTGSFVFIVLLFLTQLYETVEQASRLHFSDAAVPNKWTIFWIT